MKIVYKDQLTGVVIKEYKKFLVVKHPRYKAKRYKKACKKDIKQQINNLAYLWTDLERFTIPTIGRWGFIDQR